MRTDDDDIVDLVQLSNGCLDLGATWTYKKKSRVPGIIPGDSALSYHYLLVQHTTHCVRSLERVLYIGATTHNSRRYERRALPRARARVYRSKPVDNVYARMRRRDSPTGARAHIEYAHTRHRRRLRRLVRIAQPPSKGSLRGSKCTPLCNSQLPACKPIVCRRSQVSKSYIDAEQRRQRSSISILAVRRRARALSSRSDQ